MNRAILAAVCLFSAAPLTFGEVGEEVADSNIASYRRSQIQSAVILAAIPQLGTVLESFLFGRPSYPYLFLGTASLQQAPLYAVEPRTALLDSAALVGLGAAFTLNDAVIHEPNAYSILFNAYHKLTMYSVYQTYRSMRLEAASGAYQDSFTPHYLPQLLAAPFTPECLQDWYVWIPLTIMSGYYVYGLLTADTSKAFWNTGKTYLGDQVLPALVGLPLMFLLQTLNFTFTGVGEESLYRATYFEELRSSFGEWPAKIIDGVHFSFSHYPQEITALQSMTPLQLSLSVLRDIGLTFWLQYVYEWGGLPAAVAYHTWGDIVGFFCNWLLVSGVPNQSGYSINTKLLSISLRMKL